MKMILEKTKKERYKMSNKTNIEEDRERLIIENEILEENYENLSEDVTGIAKELDLEEDATIDEIYLAIRILKSKRTDMFEYIAKANKYDKLVEKIKKKIKSYSKNCTAINSFIAEVLEELLEGE